VEDSLDPLALEQPPERIPIAVRPDFQLRPCRDSGTVARREVIEDDDVVPSPDESINRNGADVARAAGHENSHEVLLGMGPVTDAFGRAACR
jgi:hypothetical protein